MDKGFAIAGGLIVDYVKIIDSYPKPGMLSNISSISRCIGGCAGNTLIDLAVIDPGLQLSCIGKVGGDENGAYIKELMGSYGVDTENIVTSEDVSTSFTDVMTVSGTGERTFFHGRGANAEFRMEDINFDAIDASIFHMGYALLLDSFDAPDSGFGTVMARALAMAQERGMKTSMDAVSDSTGRFADVVRPSLKHCDYAIMNEIEAGMTTGIDPRDKDGGLIVKNLKPILESMMECGVSEYAVVHMPELGCAMDSGGNFFIEGSYELPKGYIKGSVGAGDAFCAGMLYSIYKGWDMPSALKFANGAAAFNLSAENSISGMKGREEILGISFASRKVEL